MGEVVVSSSSEEAEGMLVELETEKKDIGSSEVVRWEKFLPRMVLRVLLVEADDSTRQIIAALLRKCSYIVAAVPDGLMAWETLKGGPHNIDLILTEVELPLISGYALLALVMEHEICKHIPVIRAADFLIKPIRKNELRNLWQHVWRRQTQSAGQIPQNSHKVGASSEDNAASNRSSDCATSLQKNKDCSKKGSDAQATCRVRKIPLSILGWLHEVLHRVHVLPPPLQSSYTTPCLEAESAHMQNMQGLSQLKHRSASNLSNSDGEEYEECAKLDKRPATPESKTGGTSDTVIVAERSNGMGPDGELCHGAYNPAALRLLQKHACGKLEIQEENSRPENDRGHANISFGRDDVLDESSSRAIDLIGTFNNGSESTYVHSSLHDGTNKFEFTPQLELSLRRLYPGSSKNQGVDERHALNHSNASAFSRYNSKTLQPLFPTSSNGSDFMEEASKSPELSSNQHAQNISSISQRHDATLSGNQEVMTTPVVQSGKAELAYPSPRLGLIPVPRMRVDNSSTGYVHAFSSLYHTQSSATWTPKLVGRQQSPFPTSTSVHSNPEIHDSNQNHRCPDETTYNSVDQNDHQQNNLEPVDDLSRDSPAIGQSTSSSLCNGAANYNNSSAYEGFGSRNDGNASSVVASEKAMAQENLNDGGSFKHDGFRGIDSHRSGQREAALTKFRLKRKDRCYEKKVRYQSRKRLAEQRPRVKGQFVRQVQNDSPIANG
ncbi:unnamed protein product [Dovyalis caffra]|uniref:Two-component response regulator-like APRR5 n=1 Tax=Dovyalis caffra TaxID=77055 RepID=A0AAV1SEL3_9ROSI|nr:unnamed protein product [Dovyalis caffra]